MKRALKWIGVTLLVLILATGGAGIYVYEKSFGGGRTTFQTVPPVLPAKLGQPAVLIFTKTNGFRDPESIAAATAALVGIARRQGWSAFVTDNNAVFNPDQLARFRTVVWNNVSGTVLLPDQQAAFRRYIEGGGGYVGIHGAGGDPSYSWRWYVDRVIGTQFIGHPLFPQFQRATVVVDDPADPIMAGVPARWVRTDEWYSFATSPRPYVHVLARLDERTYRPRFAWHDIAMGADHPIIWRHCVGRGRVFYSALGHVPSSYREPIYVGVLTRAIAWSAGLLGQGCDGPAG